MIYPRLLVPLLFALPFSAYAETCLIQKTDPGTISITVGKSGCFGSDAARSEFQDTLKVAVKDVEASQARAEKPATIQRSRSAQKLYNLSDMRHQARTLSGGGTYYGQK